MIFEELWKVNNAKRMEDSHSGTEQLQGSEQIIRLQSSGQHSTAHSLKYPHVVCVLILSQAQPRACVETKTQGAPK
eukprot:891871-Amphidinium_carterae.1